MQLEKLAISLRPRHPNEAIDLGIRMAMHWFKPLYGAWFCLALPTALLLFALGRWLDMSYWAISFMIWWIKPAWDRMAVFVMARVVFGEAPTLYQCVKAIPTLLFKTKLIRALTWARFTPYRSLTLPIDVLEGVKGPVARARRRAVSSYIGFNAMVLTFAGVIIETLFPICVMALLVMLSVDGSTLAPDVSLNIWDYLTNDFSLMDLCIYSLGMLLWEPVYVTAGFALYLKRRSDIEAWDLELRFRNIEKKHRATPTALFGLILAVASVGLFGYADGAVAATTADASRQQAIEKAPQTLQDILKQPEYGGKTTKRTPKLPEFSAKEKKKEKPKEKPRKDYSSSTSSGFAGVSQGALWILLALTVAALLYVIIVRLPVIKGRSKVDYQPPIQIAGLDIQPESLPKNIAEVALKMIREGDLRAALSLLFRGSLSVLAHRDRIVFRSSDTEQDCIRRVKRSEHPSSEFFVRLTRLWLAQAYAHRAPDIMELERLCLEWPTHYDHQSQWEAS